MTDKEELRIEINRAMRAIRYLKEDIFRVWSPEDEQDMHMAYENAIRGLIILLNKLEQEYFDDLPEIDDNFLWTDRK